MARRKGPLSQSYPHLASEMVTGDPNQLTPGSTVVVTWRCALGHEYDAPVYGRTREVRSMGCPFCIKKGRRKLLVGFNDLATTHPDLAGEAEGWNPATVVESSMEVKMWRCHQGHTWERSIQVRASGHGGCPVCDGKRVVPGQNDLASAFPDLAAEAVGWDPTSVTVKSAKKVQWRCSLGHEYNAAIYNRTNGTGCPVCASKVLLVGFNDLATRFPEVAAEADGWDPTTELFGTLKKMPWVCALGHQWSARVSDRTRIGNQCPYSAGNFVMPGFNDIATTHPNRAWQADGWDPTTIQASSDKVQSWKCSQGHAWRGKVSVVLRSVSDEGCPYCTGQRVLSGYNDLATTHPWLVAELVDPEVATKVAAGSERKVRWRCSEGHEWSSQVASRTRKMPANCPSCARGGFKPAEDGWLYFLRHDEWGMFQIGITNQPGVRVLQHQRRGWEVIEIRGPMPGDITYGWEQAILRALRRRHVQVGFVGAGGEFDGYTEAWPQHDFHVSSLANLMDLVHEDEELPWSFAKDYQEMDSRDGGREQR